MDGHQFHHYQQSQQAHLASNHWTQKYHDIYGVEIQILARQMHTHVAG